MPGFNIHLAVGKRYLEKIKLDKRDDVRDERAFCEGILAPDLVENKKITHYTGNTNTNDLEKYLEDKVRLTLFLKENKVDTDFEKGVFLHLLTDRLFFTEFFDKEYINNINYDDFVNCLYYSYESTNEYLYKKYDIDLSVYGDRLIKNIEKNKKEKKIENSPEQIKKRKQIFTVEELDKFIEKISDIDLKEEVKKYKE